MVKSVLLINTIHKLPEDSVQAQKHVGAFVIYVCAFVCTKYEY